MIRSLDSSGNLDKYWTGTEFSSDINQAMEITPGRALSTETRKAKKIIEEASSFTNKGLRRTGLITTESEESDYNTKEARLKKRSTYTKSDMRDDSIVDSNGKIDISKLEALKATRLSEAKAERATRVMPVTYSGDKLISNNEFKSSNQINDGKPTDFNK